MLKIILFASTRGKDVISVFCLQKINFVPVGANVVVFHSTTLG